MTENSDKVIRYRKRIKYLMIESMGKQCQICGYDKCHGALEFHHVDPKEKDFWFSDLRANPKSLPKLINELKKCILLCANCHREVHAGVTELPDTYQQVDESVLLNAKNNRTYLKKLDELIESSLTYQ